ncbi:hypothetical protein NHP21005_11840 [Helicobacter sp. NHP21005]|uniref:hypothetical protein n=1 Tax=Helicobacter felistomachi TaxID=3040201 RepID=UPI002573AD05|nr:hypothetical protein [Helicobacter sp. NHP21005]BEG57496.1 hypothetical protein NHP21005_11840 [Helicobacter sp. NHP21005]
MKKLLQEQRGQVAGAFYRPDLGESGVILIWCGEQTRSVCKSLNGLMASRLNLMD